MQIEAVENGSVYLEARDGGALGVYDAHTGQHYGSLIHHPEDTDTLIAMSYRTGNDFLDYETSAGIDRAIAFLIREWSEPQNLIHYLGGLTTDNR